MYFSFVIGFFFNFKFPKDLEKLTKNLRSLDLSDNKLPEIPPSIGSYKLLKKLVLVRNKIGI